MRLLILRHAKAVQDRLTLIKEAQHERENCKRKTNGLGDFMAECHLSCIGIDDELNYGFTKSRHGTNENIIELITRINDKLEPLTSKVTEIRGLLKVGPEKDAYYQQYVKVPLTKRACRLSPIYDKEVEDGGDEDDIDEFRLSSIDVPTAADIKTISKRVIKQGRMRRGLK
jgi:hypothetical protein